MSLTHKTSEQLRQLIAFYDTDKLRRHYTGLLAELRAELERRAKDGQLELPRPGVLYDGEE